MPTHHVTIDGLRFHCRLDGPENASEGAPWLVFSNSLATDLSMWDAQVAAFAARFRILRYDQRGHGGTAIPPLPATLDRLTEDAAALMAAFAISAATFIGVSMGAATALNLAARHPGLAHRIVASDGQAATAPGGAQAWAERIAYAEQHGMDAFADLTIPRWFAAASRENANPAVARVRAMIAATPLPGLIACARALQDYDIRPALPAIHQHTLLIAGAEDGVMPQTMRKLQQQIPGSRYVEIPAAGHLPAIEAPDAFNAALAGFLAP